LDLRGSGCLALTIVWDAVGPPEGGRCRRWEGDDGRWEARLGIVLMRVISPRTVSVEVQGPETHQALEPWPASATDARTRLTAGRSRGRASRPNGQRRPRSGARCSGWPDLDAVVGAVDQVLHVLAASSPQRHLRRV